MPPREDLVRLGHMRDHSKQGIAILAGRSSQTLAEDYLLQLGLRKIVEIVGEAADNVSADTQARLPQVRWKDIIGMRHRLVHGYDSVNLDILHRAVSEGMPQLAAILDSFLDEHDEERGAP